MAARPEASPSPTASSATATPRPSPTPIPAITEAESISEAGRLLDTLLAQGDWEGLSARLSPQLALSAQLIGYEVKFLSRQEARAWLQARWQPGLRVLNSNEIPHYGLVQFETGPWRTVAPARGTLFLGAHRYDDKGQAAMDGSWHIDGIVYGQ